MADAAVRSEPAIYPKGHMQIRTLVTYVTYCPFDWDDYWRSGAKGDRDQMSMGARNMARRLNTFIEGKGIRTLADFGCGAGETLFILAREHPDLEFRGFDVSIVAVDRNRSRAGELKTPNIWFEREDVRDISTEERFDLVLCIATLHYIKDIRKALRDLYARVDHGGFLIFNYPNRPSMYGFRDWIEKEAPELRNRYRLVLGGENLLTLDDIKETLGKRPVNFWRAVGEQPSRLNMCVYLEKGQV